MIGIVCAFFHTEGKGFYSNGVKKPEQLSPNDNCSGTSFSSRIEKTAPGGRLLFGQHFVGG